MSTQSSTHPGMTASRLGEVVAVGQVGGSGGEIDPGGGGPTRDSARDLIDQPLLLVGVEPERHQHPDPPVDQRCLNGACPALAPDHVDG
jgi:hypothetical protein